MRVAQTVEPNTKQMPNEPAAIRLTIVFAIADFITSFGLIFVTAFIYHTLGLGLPERFFYPDLYFTFAISVALVNMIIMLNSNAYEFGQSRRNVRNLRRSAYAWMTAFGICLLGAFFLQRSDELSRIAILSSFVIGGSGSLLVRGFIYSYAHRKMSLGALRFQRVVVIGRREPVVDYLFKEQLWRHGYSLMGALYLEDINTPGTGASDFFKRIKKYKPDTILLIGNWSDFTDYPDIVSKLGQIPAKLCFIPIAMQLAHLKLSVSQVGDRPVITLAGRPLSNRDRIYKRSFDIAFASCALIGLAPIFLIIGLLIKLDTKGPVFYRQRREGFADDIFDIWKFRTMSVVEKDHEFKQAEKDDPRITRVGKFLRKTNIDELPQFINVLQGTMSVVGPRPHAVAHNGMFEDKVNEFARRHHVKPGITGWAQVNGLRGQTDTLDLMRARVRYDLYYIEHWSLIFDIWIIMLTVFSARAYRNAF
jgi:Undecaprenyl-phosphate glucose phosphotransferase